MCKAYSCIVDIEKNVYWKAGLDSHEEIRKHFKLKEPRLSFIPTNEEIAKKIKWAKVEIVPKDGNYLGSLAKKDWELGIDEPIKPVWWTKDYEKPCWNSWRLWKKDVYSKINIEEARNPIHPFKIKAKEVTKDDIELLKQWALVRALVENSVWDSVGDSVWNSVGDSVWNSVWDSVRNSVRSSVGDSVWDSVWDSVFSYYGSLFLGIKKWEYVDYHSKIFKKGAYPFQPAVDLWKRGFVPSFDRNVWRLHAGPTAEIVWEGKV